MRCPIAIAVVVFMGLLLSAATAAAGAFYVTQRYALGEYDSEDDARRMAFIEARKKLWDKMYLNLESEAPLEPIPSKDVFDVYAPAMIAIRQVSEKVEIAESPIVITTISAAFNPGDFMRALKKIEKHKLSKTFTEQQRISHDLENRLGSIEESLKKADKQSVRELLKERSQVGRKWDRLENERMSRLGGNENAVENLRRQMRLD